MGNNAVDISSIQAYAEKHAKELITLAVTGKAELVQNLRLVAGITDKWTMPSLEFQRLIKPYARAWDPIDDKIAGKQRTLRVEMGQVELEEEPLAYRKSTFGLYLSEGVDPSKHPFEKVLLEGIMKQIGDDINSLLAFYGDSDESGSTADAQVIAINDGYFKIIDDEITAGTISAGNGNLITTNDITSSNAVAKLKAFYRSAMANSPGYRGKKLNLYISHTVMDSYNDDYQSSNGALPYNKEFEKTFLEGTGRNVTLVPMTGMGTSKRLILSPKENMLMGVDLLSDTEKVQITKGINPKVMGIFAAFAIGFQFATLKAMWTNENTIDDESSSSSSASNSSSSSSSASA